MLSLQKTGSRLKRLISHRRHSSLDSSGNAFEDPRFTDTKLPINPTKRLSWLSQSPTVDISPIRRSKSYATGQKYTLPTANATAHSSATSLCSCDCAENPSSNNPPLLTEAKTSNQPEILYLPPLSSRKDSSDAQTWRLIFQETPPQSTASISPRRIRRGRPTATIAPGSTFDVIGALAMDSTDNENTPRRDPYLTNDSDIDDFSDDVERLIRETDAAFKAVGNALAEAKAATQGWYDTETPVSRSPPVPRGILKKNENSLRSTAIPLKIGNQPLLGLLPVGKKKSPKRSLLNRALRSVPVTPADTPSRWTLNDVTTKTVDVFSGKIFRTEVDEMLTPGRLQQLQDSIHFSHEGRQSADSARSIGTEEETPTEPFHLQSLSNRIDAAQKSPLLPPPPPPAESKRQAPPRPPRPQKVHFADGEVSDYYEEGMTIESLTFPSPPRPPPRRISASTVPHLPTIPEVSPISPLNISPSSTPTLSPSPPSPLTPDQLLENDDLITLPSTPTTLTSPLFLHGPIRVPTPYHEPRFSYSEGEEEKLDWTAFQMAISGTDGYDEREEQEVLEWEEMEILVDDLVTWWAEFGFVDWGRMVGDESLDSKYCFGSKDEEKKGRKRRTRECIERIVPVLDPNAYLRHSGTPSEVLDSAKIVIHHGHNEEPSLSTGWDTLDVRRKDSTDTDSLPPSPMLDLVLPSQSKGEIVPMGFNLQHDLGDFLRWEMENVQTFFGEY